jgi:hypothetical protein
MTVTMNSYLQDILDTEKTSQNGDRRYVVTRMHDGRYLNFKVYDDDGFICTGQNCYIALWPTYEADKAKRWQWNTQLDETKNLNVHGFAESRDHAVELCIDALLKVDTDLSKLDRSGSMQYRLQLFERDGDDWTERQDKVFNSHLYHDEVEYGRMVERAELWLGFGRSCVDALKTKSRSGRIIQLDVFRKDVNS